MNAASEFDWQWIFSGLPDVRNSLPYSTYEQFPYLELPPLSEQFDGQFRWLADQPEAFVNSWSDDRWTTYISGLIENRDANLIRLREQASSLNLHLPESYFHFFETTSLIRRIRSCTDCGFESSGRIAPSPFGDGHFIMFLVDSQCCCEWSIFLKDDGSHCITVSWGLYSYFCDEFDECEDPYDSQAIGAFICAPNFEAFVYRFWLENEIWFKLADDIPLNSIEQKYVNHYIAG